jgi:hypothetical protein
MAQNSIITFLDEGGIIYGDPFVEIEPQTAGCIKKDSSKFL